MATELQWAVGDLSLIAFYYLLRIGKYTRKPARTKQAERLLFEVREVSGGTLILVKVTTNTYSFLFVHYFQYTKQLSAALLLARTETSSMM